MKPRVRGAAIRDLRAPIRETQLNLRAS